MRLFIVAATLLICESFARKEEIYSAVEELLTLTENDEIVIGELKKLIVEIEKGVELTKK